MYNVTLKWSSLLLNSLQQISEVPKFVAAAVPNRNASWIGWFAADDGDKCYFIFIEQSVLCTVNSLSMALFIWFSLFYLLNLEYVSNLKDLCLFFQVFVFGLSDNTSKKNSTYLSITTDVQSFALR